MTWAGSAAGRCGPASSIPRVMKTVRGSCQVRRKPAARQTDT